MTGRIAGWLAVALGAALLLASGCREIPDVEPPPDRTTAPAVIAIELPETIGTARRPAVEFDHGLHSEALEQEGCERCHAEGDDGALDYRFVDAAQAATRGDWMAAYHDGCAECHDERRAAGDDTGPETTVCAACHVKQPRAASARVAPRFDRSLHGRHSVALEDRCEECHHVRDEATGERVYREHEEAACFVCHGEQPGDHGEPPLRSAAHDACIGCHLQRQGEGSTGPTTCSGCHDEAALAELPPMDPPPRIERGQEDHVTIHADGSEAPGVPFDHAAHEARTDRCSDCHHANLEACDDCHTRTGLPDGGGVSLEQAYHQASSARSCVGCHDEETERTSCAGCHVATPTPPSERSCALCHVDPPPAAAPPAEMLARAAEGSDGSAEGAVQDAAAHPAPAAWPPLPPSSEAFPEEVVIDRLADEYEASTLPHRAIVEALDRDIRASELATHFHGSSELTCTGCHHHTPAGERPPPCASCHGPTDRMDQDRPSLKHAYHRQCMDCHEAMAIDEQGCTDCHAEAGKEDAE